MDAVSFVLSDGEELQSSKISLRAQSLSSTDGFRMSGECSSSLFRA